MVKIAYTSLLSFLSMYFQNISTSVSNEFASALPLLRRDNRLAGTHLNIMLGFLMYLIFSPINLHFFPIHRYLPSCE